MEVDRHQLLYSMQYDYFMVLVCRENEDAETLSRHDGNFGVTILG